MQPEIHIGPLTLQTFGIMFALSFVGAGALVAARLRQLGKPVDWAYEVVFSALAGGIIGARLYYMAQHWDRVSDDFFGTLTSGEGLVWYGGAIGGAIAVVIWAHRRGFLGLVLLDVMAAPLALGYAIGRIGCHTSGDGDYGKVWDGPFAVGYPNGTVPTPPGVKVHPTPIYEALSMTLIAYVLWRLRDRFRPGVLFAIYLLAAGTERFLVEFIRRNSEVVAGLTAPQLESLAMMVAGAAWIWLVRSRRGSLAPAPA